ncbi:adenosine deaminase-like protein [Argonauta hians]
MDAFCVKLPKIELHAHINSSVSAKTLQEISQEKTETVEECKKSTYSSESKENQALDKYFNVFTKIHEVTVNEKSIYKITYDVIHDFCNDNVKYVELRTTPRAEVSTGMTRRSYVNSVLEAIKDCKKESLDIEVRLLLSIDRRTTIKIAEDVVDIAVELLHKSDGIVLGLDFSGDPKVNDATVFIPLLRKAKSNGLKLAIHLAEVLNTSETQELLLVEPDRIGHGTFLPPEVGGTKEMVQLIRSRNIPIECCLTSNLMSDTVSSLDKHQFGFWYKQSHPVVIATDGAGVFNTKLSKEYCLAAQTFSLTKEKLWEISYKSIDYIFASEHTKEQLQRKWNEMKDSVCS